MAFQAWFLLGAATMAVGCGRLRPEPASEPAPAPPESPERGARPEEAPSAPTERPATPGASSDG